MKIVQDFTEANGENLNQIQVTVTEHLLMWRFSSRTKTSMMKLTTENGGTTFVYYSLETSSNLEGRKHQKIFHTPACASQ